MALTGSPEVVTDRSIFRSSRLFARFDVLRRSAAPAGPELYAWFFREIGGFFVRWRPVWRCTHCGYGFDRI